MKQLSEIGEDALIEQLIKDLDQGDDVLVGPGDDCAVVDLGAVSGLGAGADVYQLLKTDAIVEGVHYLPDTPAAEVGWKAVARVLSDFAAMGGCPGNLLVTIALAPDQEVCYVQELYRGLKKCADLYGAVICGGETSSVPHGSAAVISVAGTGWVKKNQLVRRSGGQVGDLVLVTGKLGGSIQGKHLSFTPRLEEAKWMTENFAIRSMMDLSDGLARDLPRLAKASGCNFVIDEASLPCNQGCDAAQAMNDGEDYELLLTVSPQVVSRLLESWSAQFSALPLTVVGELIEGQVRGAQGGWEHFTETS